MDKKLKEIIKNAKTTALKIDGYNQSIILTNNGEYSFTRSCEGCCPSWYGKIIGEIKTFWEAGIFKAKYVARQ